MVSTLVLVTLALSSFLLPLQALAAPIPRADATKFQADPSIDVAKIYNAAKTDKSDLRASYRREADSSDMVNMYGDWTKTMGSSVIHFMGDMDVDCDGADSQCADATSSQSETSWGNLAADKVPYFVVPEGFKNPLPKPNSLGAIICDGKMYYGIFGDQNGSNPPVIGEASILLAQTCFPKDKLNGNNGHTPTDVAYIMFTDQVPSGVGKETIDIGALKTLGDKMVKELEQKLN